MTFAAAKRLATRILREDPALSLKGFSTYNPDGGYSVILIDTRSRYEFTISNLRTWRERRKATNLADAI